MLETTGMVAPRLDLVIPFPQVGPTTHLHTNHHIKSALLLPMPAAAAAAAAAAVAARCHARHHNDWSTRQRVNRSMISCLKAASTWTWPVVC